MSHNSSHSLTSMPNGKRSRHKHNNRWTQAKCDRTPNPEKYLIDTSTWDTYSLQRVELKVYGYMQVGKANNQSNESNSAGSNTTTTP
jgi:hypothetical protein